MKALPRPRQLSAFLFEATIHRSEAEPKGCMLVNTAVELSVHDPEAAERANEAF
ncbi:hypothetical protein ACFSQ7_16970 [Paenibacillus rhizoplanae]